MGKKACIAGFTAILLVAAVIGIIAACTRSRHSLPIPLSAPSKSVAALCYPTTFKDACERTLLSASINATSTTGDIIRAAVNVISSEVDSANLKAHELHNQANTSIDNDGFEFCKQLLGDAGDQLAAVITEADNGHRIDDFQAWLSMVISYRTNCLASIEAPELNQQMTDALRNATELTDNALAIMTVVGEIADKLHVNISRIGRRLNSNDGYPAWVAAGDRKMLASRVVGARFRPNAVVAKDGSGGFRSISDALNAMPES